TKTRPQSSAVTRRDYWVWHETQRYAWPADRGGVSDGLRRTVRIGRHRLAIRLPRRDSPAADHACNMGAADSADGRGIGKCTAGRRRLLCVGQEVDGAVLGIHGSVALARRQHLRYGAVPNAVRQLPGAYEPGDYVERERALDRRRHDCRLRRSQPWGREICQLHFVRIHGTTALSVCRARRLLRVSSCAATSL